MSLVTCHQLFPTLLGRLHSLPKIIRDSLATLLGHQKEDVKTVQELVATRTRASPWRSTSRQVATRSGTLSAPCPACFFRQQRTPATEVRANEKGSHRREPFSLLQKLVSRYSRECPFLFSRFEATFPVSPLECGGDDGARTRDLCRDRAAF